MTPIEIDIQGRTGGNQRRLENFGYKLYSQSDEDGILAEIFARIGTTNRTFVEIGVESGIECNTLRLLREGWSGLWIEGYPDYFNAIQRGKRRRIASGQLKLAGTYVTADNINDLISGAGIEGEIDLFSLDIDSNDYHVLDALNVIRPRVLVVEHNHSYEPPLRYVMPRDDNYRWTPAKSDYGASLTSLTELAASKGYTIVGCGLYSPNSFHVRSDLVQDKFAGPFSPEHFWNPLEVEKIFSYPRGLRGAHMADPTELWSKIDRLEEKLEKQIARNNTLEAKVADLRSRMEKYRKKSEELKSQHQARRRPLRGWLGRLFQWN